MFSLVWPKPAFSPLCTKARSGFPSARRGVLEKRYLLPAANGQGYGLPRMILTDSKSFNLHMNVKILTHLFVF